MTGTIMPALRTMLAALLLASAAQATAAGAMKAVSPRTAAPDFTLRNMDGKPYRLSGFHGKVVLINFWATWCPPCRKEMPSMQRAWEKLKSRDFMMLAVNVGEDEDTIFGFVFATGVELTFPILLDKEGKVIKDWPVRGLPTTFIIDRRGRIAYQAVGGREWDEPALLEKVRLLINESGG